MFSSRLASVSCNPVLWVILPSFLDYRPSDLVDKSGDSEPAGISAPRLLAVGPRARSGSRGISVTDCNAGAMPPPTPPDVKGLSMS